MTVSAHGQRRRGQAPPGAWRTATSSGWTSGRCPAAPWWSGSATARKSAPRSAPTGTRSWTPSWPRPASRCRRTGRCRTRRTTGTCCARRCPAAVRAAGIDPAQVIGIGTDFTACTVLPVPARRHPAVPGARAGGSPARLPQAVEAPRGPAPGGPDQRAGPRVGRAVDRPVRRQDLLGVAVRQGARAAGGRPGHLPAGGPLDRSGRLDHLAAVRHRDPQHLHGRLQGHLPGRPLSLGGLPRRAEPRLRQLRRGQAGSSGVAARGPGGRADRRGGRVDRAARGHRRGRGQRGRARHPARR